ncbi:hypothetical protein JOD55_000988 [Arcanobacterium pluranimalium]|uniref:DUF7832 domain-containing protein n=1 Tax=Arcanobacterium pluranimalium TaxID=108028 RepID=UPI00195A3FB0|nr:hypothetical protein [Arcanobacterium pluranimalium]MBM7825161.1 hypothetical protein [Arcanobacterium pluranimalium]
MGLFSFFKKNDADRKTKHTFKDKAGWHFDSAMEEYLDETGKNENELSESDLDDVWARAHGHMVYPLMWAIDVHKISDELIESASEDIEKIKSRTLSPDMFFSEHCDEILCDYDFNDETSEFLSQFYAEYVERFTNSIEMSSTETSDAEISTTKTQAYRPFSWDIYDEAAKPILDEMYSHWINGRPV